MNQINEGARRLGVRVRLAVFVARFLQIDDVVVNQEKTCQHNIGMISQPFIHGVLCNRLALGCPLGSRYDCIAKTP